MVAGDAVNPAARVQSAADSGAVLVDGATFRLAGSAVGFADAGEHVLKGKAEPQQLWRATRVLAAGGAGRGAAHDPGVVSCGSGTEGAAAGPGVRAGRGGEVAAGVGVREIRRWVGR